jgi:cell pole-organizing protein PopZ
MSEPNAQEPTMEEILASIRRIISEDEPPAGEVEADAETEALIEPMADPEPEDVLELTEVAPEPAPAAAVESLGDLDLYPPAEARPKTDTPPPVAAAAPSHAPAPVRDTEPLVSEVAAHATASAFGQLAQRVAMPREGRTLEDLVREMLNPLLRAWLDENLPAIVQAKVEEEVERIARRHV